MQRPTSNKKTTLDVSHLQPGVYFVRYTGETGNLFGKFIKNYRIIRIKNYDN
ncbi:MAG: T9SS type A sorting domain-containing protein [Bacteroidetes bacterium]|nr:T9SS type A sorting domain-containing protein [Bacteroidota bacterium]